MSDRNTLVFADYDPVVGNNNGINGPAIDGFFDRDYMITNEPTETGYAGGSLVTFGDTSPAPVIFKGVRKTGVDKLVFGFLCRFSDVVSGGQGTQDDEIIIILSAAPGGGGERRLIRINPVGNSGVTGGTQVNQLPDPPGDDSKTIRTNSPPRSATIHKPNGTGGWDVVTPAGIEIAVRSWSPSPGDAVPELAWSVEVAVPRTAAAGGGAANWMDIANHFGVYFQLSKILAFGDAAVGTTRYIFPLDAPFYAGFNPANATLPAGLFGDGYSAPVPAGVTSQGVHFTGGNLGIFCRQSPSVGFSPHQIAASNNQMVALLGNGGTTNAADVQVEFRLAHWGLPAGNIQLWDRPDGLLPVMVPVTGQAVNAGSSNIEFATDPWPLDNVTANYKGSGLTQRGFFAAHPHQCMWAQASSLSGQVNFTQSSVRRNMDFVGLSEVERDAVVSGEGYEKPADGSGEHTFILRTFSRRVVIQQIVDNAKDLDDDAKLLLGTALQTATGDRDGGGDIRPADMMMTHRTTGRRAQTQYKDSVVYLWTTLGYRLTEHTVLVSGKSYPLLDNGCGSFGFAAHHTGVGDNLSWAFSGPGLGQFGPGIYGLKVPHKGSVTIKTRLSAEPNGPKGDASQDLPKLDPKEWLPPVKGGDHPGDPNPDPRPEPDPKSGICGLIALGIVGVPLVWAASQLVA
jgi:hypothetical protein